MRDGQAQALVEDAALFWGGCASWDLLMFRDNAVFDVTLRDGTRGIMRVHREGYHADDEIRSELWWLEAMADSNHHVPRPIRTIDQTYLGRLQDGRLVSFLEWLPGECLGVLDPPKDMSRDEKIRFHASVGRAAAEIHVAADRLQFPRWFTRPHWNAEGLLGSSQVWGRFWENTAASEAEQAILSAARVWLEAYLADYAQGADQGLIHGDLDRDNMLLDGHHVRLIDFDDCGFGFRMYDLASCLIDLLDDPDLGDIVIGLTTGYGTQRPLSDADQDALPVFVLVRCLVLAGWSERILGAQHPQNRTTIERAVKLSEQIMARESLW